MEALEDQDWVASRLKKSKATLKSWRASGQGPAFLRVGRHVRYRPSDVEAWLERQRVQASMGDAA